TSDTLQRVAPFPRSLVVIGGGYVGLEFASMFAHFGSSVTVLDRGERPLKHEDEDVAETLTQILTDDGVELMSDALVTSVEESSEHATVQFRRSNADPGETLGTVEAEAVLIALGRTPVTERLGLARAGIQTADRGYIVVDESLRTSAPGVYAVGDVN